MKIQAHRLSIEHTQQSTEDWRGHWEKDQARPNHAQARQLPATINLSQVQEYLKTGANHSSINITCTYRCKLPDWINRQPGNKLLTQRNKRHRNWTTNKLVETGRSESRDRVSVERHLWNNDKTKNILETTEFRRTSLFIFIFSQHQQHKHRHSFSKDEETKYALVFHSCR